MENKQDYTKSLFNTLQTEIVEVLNYSGVICKVNISSIDKLEKWLKLDNINKLWRLETVKENGYFYIENCDLQDLVTDIEHDNVNDLILDMKADGYIIAKIYFHKNGFMLKEES